MKHPKQFLRTSSLSLALAAAFPLHAAETELPPVVVTADRMARSVDDTLVPVSVITRADIEREQARSLQDVLRGLPGVTITNTGGPGKQTSLFVRGTNSDQVLVLIDGYKVGSATSGAAALQNIPIEQVERIELVRGPRASLYGSDAIGGVLQIFTRKGGGAMTPSFSLSGGSHSTLGGSANLSGGTENAWYNAGVTYERTSGINACSGSNGGCFANEPDLDSYKNAGYTLRGGYRFAPGYSFELLAFGGYSQNEFDGGFQNYSKDRTQVLGGSFNFAPTSNWQSLIRVGQSTDNSDAFLGNTFASRFNTTRTSATWQNDVTLSDGQVLTLGLDTQTDKIDSSVQYTTDSRYDHGAFAQYSGSFGATDLQFALREDNNEQFGNHTTGSLGVGYTLSPALRLTLGGGTAFKAPSFNQLYYPGYGSADLQPETARNAELGASGTAGGVSWQANLFQMRVNNLIAGYPLANISRAEMTGLELAAQTRLDKTSLSGSLTLQNPVDKSGGANDNNLLPRRARSVGRFDVDHALGAWSLGATLFAQGSRYDDLANKNKLAGYGTVDLRAEYRVTPAWRLQARIENLFDKQYETAAYYNQPGAGAYLTLRYQPQ